MRKKSIIMSGEMVRALLDGRKTQTRRVMNPQPVFRSGNRTIPNWWEFKNCTWSDGLQPFGIENHAPYQPGDVLWVKEVYALHLDGKTVFYRADDEKKYETDGKWQSPIHMPRWESRINLEVVGVKVERVQNITLADILAEGVSADICRKCEEYYGEIVKGRCEDAPCSERGALAEAFVSLWDSLHKNRPGCDWDSNPWVFAYSFREIE